MTIPRKKKKKVREVFQKCDMPKNKRESESSQNELPTSHLLYRKANFVINEASFAFKNLLYSLKLENKKFSIGFQDLQLLLRYH